MVYMLLKQILDDCDMVYQVGSDTFFTIINIYWTEDDEGQGEIQCFPYM